MVHPPTDALQFLPEPVPSNHLVRRGAARLLSLPAPAVALLAPSPPLPPPSDPDGCLASLPPFHQIRPPRYKGSLDGVVPKPPRWEEMRRGIGHAVLAPSSAWPIDTSSATSPHASPHDVEKPRHTSMLSVRPPYLLSISPG
uniref:Uncharacterized protein n=1 Tax=Arundo donax TaxID=35708 RepID=A0A0A9HPS1_ARUDO